MHVENIVRILFSLFFPAPYAFLLIKINVNCATRKTKVQYTSKNIQEDVYSPHCHTLKGGTLFEQYSIKVSKSQPLYGLIRPDLHRGVRQSATNVPCTKDVPFETAVNGKSRKKKKKKRKKEKKEEGRRKVSNIPGSTRRWNRSRPDKTMDRNRIDTKQDADTGSIILDSYDCNLWTKADVCGVDMESL